MRLITKLITQLTIATCLLATAGLAAEAKSPASPAPSSTVVTLTLGDLVNSQLPLSRLLSADLPVRAAWARRNLARVIEEKLTLFNDQRADLIKRHKGVLDVKANLYTFPEAEVAGWNADFKTLTEIKVELHVSRIPLSSLPDTLHLSASDMAHLEPFLLDDEVAGGDSPSPAVTPASKTAANPAANPAAK